MGGKGAMLERLRFPIPYGESDPYDDVIKFAALF